MKFKHIVVATDLTEYSLLALQNALELAETLGARLTLLHALEPTPTPPGLEAFALEGMPIDWADRVTQGQRQVAERKLAELSTQYATKTTPIATRTVFGIVPDSLNQELKEIGADLLIVGSHGRRGVAHFFLGSVAEQLMRTAPCPVLIIRPPVAK